MHNHTAHGTSLWAIAAITVGIGLHPAPTFAQKAPYDDASANQARNLANECGDAWEAVTSHGPDRVIAICKENHGAMVQIYTSRTSNTPMDWNFLRIYSGLNAYVIMAADLKKNDGKRLSADGCDHAAYVVRMADELTMETAEIAEKTMRESAQLLRENILPSCGGG